MKWLCGEIAGRFWLLLAIKLVTDEDSQRLVVVNQSPISILTQAYAALISCFFVDAKTFKRLTRVDNVGSIQAVTKIRSWIFGAVCFGYSAVHAAPAGCRSCRVVNRVCQRGSNCGSITGPISVASGCFPLSNVLVNTAKLFRLRRF